MNEDNPDYTIRLSDSTDPMPVIQGNCYSLRQDRCYRFWLGKNFQRFGYVYCSFYYPNPNESLDSCDYYVDINPYKD